MRTKTYNTETFHQTLKDASFLKDNLFDALTDHVIITDDDGVILYANRAAEEKTGYSREEMFGKTPGELWGNGMNKEFYRNMWQIIKTEKNEFRGTVLNTRKDGNQYYAELRIYPVHDASGKSVFFIGIEPDITNVIEEQKQKDNIFSSVVHNMKSPLAAEEMFLSILSRDRKLTPEQKEIISGAQKATDNLSEYIKDLLVFSRLNNKTEVATANRADLLINILEGIVMDVAPMVKGKKMKILIEGDGDIAVANSPILRLILQNIIQNAVYYGFKNSGIVIKFDSTERGIQISCRDKGIGIPKDQKAMVFKPFFRASNAGAVREGTGLGLYMAKSLADSFGYQIWFDSFPGEGTTFYLDIPTSK